MELVASGKRRVRARLTGSRSSRLCSMPEKKRKGEAAGDGGGASGAASAAKKAKGGGAAAAGGAGPGGLGATPATAGINGCAALPGDVLMPWVGLGTYKVRMSVLAAAALRDLRCRP